MRVKCTVLKYEEVEVEIDDKFRKLAVNHSCTYDDIASKDYRECAKAVEQATGLNFGDVYDNNSLVKDPYIIAVTSTENNKTMIEW